MYLVLISTLSEIKGYFYILRSYINVKRSSGLDEGLFSRRVASLLTSTATLCIDTDKVRKLFSHDL